MLSLAALWAPILLASVLVFVASSLIHMVFQWHKADYQPLPQEEALRAALRNADTPPGQYAIPHCADGRDFQKAEIRQKFVDGPVMQLTVRPSGLPSIGRSLGQWFACVLLVAVLTAGLACTVLAVGESPHKVFHFFAIVTLMSYGTGSVINGIWMGKPWASVARDLLDATIYALVSAATFAWLWPH